MSLSRGMPIFYLTPCNPRRALLGGVQGFANACVRRCFIGVDSPEGCSTPRVGLRANHPMPERRRVAKARWTRSSHMLQPQGICRVIFPIATQHIVSGTPNGFLPLWGRVRPWPLKSGPNNVTKTHWFQHEHCENTLNTNIDVDGFNNNDISVFIGVYIFVVFSVFCIYFVYVGKF